MPGHVGAALGSSEQLFPFVAREPAAIDIGARELAAVVEEPLVVILLLERVNFPRDEIIEDFEIFCKVIREGEVHGGVSSVVLSSAKYDA